MATRNCKEYVVMALRVLRDFKVYTTQERKAELKRELMALPTQEAVDRRKRTLIWARLEEEDNK